MITYTMIQIGAKVKRLRELRNLNQKYLADTLEITQSTYSRYEKDELRFTPEMLEKLSPILGLSVLAIEQFNEERLFSQIESSRHREEIISTKELELTQDLIEELKKENDYLRTSLQDLRQFVSWLKKE